MPPCLTLGIIRYESRVEWSNPAKGVIPRYHGYWQGCLGVGHDYGWPSDTLIGLIFFSSLLVLCKKQIVSSWIWIQAITSISYKNNHYVTKLLIFANIVKYVSVRIQKCCLMVSFYMYITNLPSHHSFLSPSHRKIFHQHLYHIWRNVLFTVLFSSWNIWVSGNFPCKVAAFSWLESQSSLIIYKVLM